MKAGFNIIVGLLFIGSVTLESRAQQVSEAVINQSKSEYSEAYGSDYNLVNGIRYLNLHPQADGHPFMETDQYTRGRIQINDRVYTDAELKYDISNQQVILKYQLLSGSIEQIILVNETIREFEVYNRTFQRIHFPGVGAGFYQVISDDSISCLYFWNKPLVKGSSSGYYYKYLPEIRESYLLIGDRLIHFRGQRSFLKAFPEKYHKDIKGFLRANSVKFSVASDDRMQRLMIFCNNLVREK